MLYHNCITPGQWRRCNLLDGGGPWERGSSTEPADGRGLFADGSRDGGLGTADAEGVEISILPSRRPDEHEDERRCGDRDCASTRRADGDAAEITIVPGHVCCHTRYPTGFTLLPALLYTLFTDVHHAGSHLLSWHGSSEFKPIMLEAP